MKKVLVLFVFVAVATGQNAQRSNFYNFRPETQSIRFVDPAYTSVNSNNNNVNNRPEQLTAAASQAYEEAEEEYDEAEYEDDEEEEELADIKTTRSANQENLVKDDFKGSAYTQPNDKVAQIGKGWDASYAFGYDLDDQSRHESSDPQGNVKGYYQYIDDEGNLRKITYTAGPETGFVVTKKEKIRDYGRPNYVSGPVPKPRPVQSYPTTPTPPPYITPEPKKQPPYIAITPVSTVSTTEGYATDEDEDESDNEQVYQSTPPTSGYKGKKKKPLFIVKIRRPAKKTVPIQQTQRVPIRIRPIQAVITPSAAPSIPATSTIEEEEEDDGQYDPRYDEQYNVDESSYPADRSYSFGYESGTSNRIEESDQFGNVRGSYSYIDPAGVRRTVHYIAGGATGYQVLPSLTTSQRRRHISSSKASVTPVQRPVPIPLPVSSSFSSSQPSTIVYHLGNNWDFTPSSTSRLRRPVQSEPIPIPVQIQPLPLSTNNAVNTNNKKFFRRRARFPPRANSLTPGNTQIPISTTTSTQPTTTTEELPTTTMTTTTTTVPPPPPKRHASLRGYTGTDEEYHPRYRYTAEEDYYDPSLFSNPSVNSDLKLAESQRPPMPQTSTSTTSTTTTTAATTTTNIPEVAEIPDEIPISSLTNFQEILRIVPRKSSTTTTSTTRETTTENPTFPTTTQRTETSTDSRRIRKKLRIRDNEVIPRRRPKTTTTIEPLIMTTDFEKLVDTTPAEFTETTTMEPTTTTTSTPPRQRRRRIKKVNGQPIPSKTVMRMTRAETTKIGLRTGEQEVPAASSKM